MDERLVSVVLVTWNSARFLRRCFDGIARQTHRELERIAVDNGSADDSAALVERAGFRVIRNENNRGFSAAVNQAIAIARGDFILLVNPDCYLEAEYVERIVAALANAGETFGSATGRLMRAIGDDIEPTTEIDSMGMRMTRTGRHLDITDPGLTPGPTANSQRATGSGQRAAAFEIFGPSGAAAMFRATYLRDVAIDGEVLDEDFFAYREDADLAWRGQLFGWRSLCVPEAVAYHVRRVTPETRRRQSADVNMHSVKNRFLLRIKNEGAYLALRNAPFELSRDLVVIVAALTVERTSLPAFAWLWKNRSHVLAKRRAIQRRRRVSDRDLARWFR